MKKLLYTLFAFVPLWSEASNETKKWYQAKNGEFLVREANTQRLHAILAKSRNRQLNLHIFAVMNQCRDKKAKKHSPMYVNNVMVNFTHYCQGKRRLFSPSTDQGRQYLIDQFKKRNQVIITTKDQRFTMRFSAIGFSKIYQQLQ